MKFFELFSKNSKNFTQNNLSSFNLSGEGDIGRQEACLAKKEVKE